MAMPVDELALCKRHTVDDPRISVLVRLKDEIAALPLFWERMQRQTIFAQSEIIFLDSGSTDGTLEFLLEKPCSLYRLEGEFNFGRSCNQIASLASAPILFFLSGHVLLDAEDTLERIVEILEKHPDGALYLRQAPNTLLGCSAYEAAYLARRFPAGNSTVQMKKPASFSNAASALTRAAWEKLPFAEVHGSEDFLWAAQHIASGGSLFYTPQLHAMHSHNETPEQLHSRVRLNAEARSETRSYARAAYYFAGVYFSMRRAGAAHGEALRYARAHSRAYL